jgi:4-hydroxyproline epimerase
VDPAAPQVPIPAAISVVDSHTEGEPTRVVVDGWPEVAGETMAARREELRRQHDHLRRAVVCEPRGHDAVVGALLTPPVAAGSAAGVVFFNNVGYLGMCGHGLIGVARTLEFLGRGPGREEERTSAGRGEREEQGRAAGEGEARARGQARELRIDTPVGTVSAEISAEDGGAGAVTITNVPARCHALDVAVEVPGLGRVVGDVAYGGNWFFLAELAAPPLTLDQLAPLSAVALAIRSALAAAGVTGADGAEIDHVELSGPSAGPHADSRNFVMCPGGAYDRSPCGTGTSAKLAVLHARGRLAPGELWRQESITGGLFTAWLAEEQGVLVPRLRGRAFVTGRATLFFDPRDPFRAGFPVP